ncbi:hypothetical protein [Catellatospora coxensis]|nr:hypothetical protein [Catellatospora coxensis]
MSLLTIACALAAAIWLTSLADSVELLGSARQRWKGYGYGLMVLCVAAVVLGAVLHAGWARKAGRSLAQGWRNTALVLVHLAVVGLVAWFVGPGIKGGFSAPGGNWYFIWLTTIVLSVAWAGSRGSFFRPAAPAADAAPNPSVASAATPRLFSRNAVLHVGLSWAVTSLPLIGAAAIAAASSR